MAKDKNNEQIVKVIAEFKVSSPDGEEMIRTHSAAWRRAYELPTPVLLTFLGYAKA